MELARTLRWEFSTISAQISRLDSTSTGWRSPWYHARLSTTFWHTLGLRQVSSLKPTSCHRKSSFSIARSWMPNWRLRPARHARLAAPLSRNSISFARRVERRIRLVPQAAPQLRRGLNCGNCLHLIHPHLGSVEILPSTSAARPAGPRWQRSRTSARLSARFAIPRMCWSTPSI